MGQFTHIYINGTRIDFTKKTNEKMIQAYVLREKIVDSCLEMGGGE